MKSPRLEGSFAVSPEDVSMTALATLRGLDSITLSALPNAANDDEMAEDRTLREVPDEVCMGPGDRLDGWLR